MSEYLRINTPLSDEIISKLKSGDRILLNGVIYTARDTAHKRLINLINENRELPFNIKGQVIYYVGPTPPKPGQVIGSAGPTTSYRMDPYAPKLIELGLKGMIGKGPRSEKVKNAMQKHKAVYLGATGGAAALISKTIKKAEVIAYEDLGPEAIMRLEVEDMLLFVINDINGNDLYIDGQKKYRNC